MKCIKCAHEYEGKFCPECGTPAEIICPKCNISITGKFCSECGYSALQQEEPKRAANYDFKLRPDTPYTPPPSKPIAVEQAPQRITNAEATVPPPKVNGFWSNFNQQVNDMANEQKALKERVKQLDKDGVAYCPKCFSTSLSANKKGFGIGKAVIGGFVGGPIGLVAGNIGAKKVRVTCLKCGHQFIAGHK